MNVKALACYVGPLRIGILFQYGHGEEQVVSRFVADEEFIALGSAPTVSASFLAATPEEQAAFWRDIRSASFNGRYSDKNGCLLPAFFQNLLPEGVFRDHVAALRGCAPTDHFEMLAACGKDLPGNVYALPVHLSRAELARYVTQDQDSLEMSVSADPMPEGVSLSGVQPKLGVIRDGERYVGRTRNQDTHIIAKLPVIGFPMLPELEHLSLRMAQAAGVQVCETYLEPLEKLAVAHHYDLGNARAKTNFLAVIRYDRGANGRIHCEDFAQILGEMPEDKYGGAARDRTPRTYLSIAAVLMDFPTLGEPAVHELLRRIVVNEMLGNPDMHLKNLGLCYPDGVTPKFPPAYDIVAFAAYNKNHGHALSILPPDRLPAAAKGESKQRISPAMLRAFCADLGIPEKPAAKAIADCVKAALEKWPSMLEQSLLTGQQKQRLLQHFFEHPLVASLAKRKRRGAVQSAA